jgi:signal transduction histidine kinase
MKNHHYLIAIFSILLFFNSTAQRYNIDSLVSTIEYEHDTALIDALYGHGAKLLQNDIENGFVVLKHAYALNQKLDYKEGVIKWYQLQGDYYKHKNDWESMLACGDSALEYSVKQDYTMGMAEAKSYKAGAYVYKGEYARGLALLEEVLPLFEKLGKKRDRMIALGNMAIMHDNLGDLPLAIEKYLRSIEIAYELKDSTIIAILLANTAITYRNLKDYPKALNNFRKSLNMRIALGHTRALADLYGNLGVIYKNTEQPDSAAFYFQKQLDLSIELEDRSEEASALHNFGSLEYRKGDYKRALGFYEKSLKIKEDEKTYKKGIATTLSNIADCHMYLGNHTKADKVNKRVIKLGLEMGSLEIQIGAFENQISNFEMVGDYKTALDYNKRYDKFQDSLINRDKMVAIEELNTKFETAEKERLILKQDLELQKNEATVKAQQNQLIIVGGGLLLLLLSGGFFFYRNTQRQKIKLEITRSEEQQKGFKAVITATEDERKRIAKDLHDGVVQQLGAINLSLSQVSKGLEPEKAKEVEQIKTIVSSTADETRTLSHQMMPKTLIELGLIAAMNDVLQSLKMSNVEVNFENFNLKDRYENSVEIAIYRIFQELTNNIIKHAGATSVEVQLFENSKKLILIVEDNGHGIKSKSKDGIGLSNIKSRLSTLDGKVDYSSGAESGTVATVVVPV